MQDIPYLSRAFSQMLHEYREKSGLSQRKLAASIGCARSYIAFLESGEHMPSLNTFLLLAKAFGVDSLEFHAELKMRVTKMEEDEGGTPDKPA